MNYQKARVDWVEAARKARRLLAKVSSRTVQIASKCHAGVRAIEPWGILVALLGVGIALVSILVDLEDRQSERTFRAWQLVLTAPLAGSSRRETIEYLNRDFDGFMCGNPVTWVSGLLTGNRARRCVFPSKARESLAAIGLAGANLTGADLTGAYLANANLAAADLTDADLTDANLAAADLAGANLTGADLTDANLTYADLTYADLAAADLTYADLTFADLTGANLTFADLTGANLRDTRLTQVQLDAACGASTPRNIPQQRTWRSRPCPVNAQ